MFFVFLYVYIIALPNLHQTREKSTSGHMMIRFNDNIASYHLHDTWHKNSKSVNWSHLLLWPWPQTLAKVKKTKAKEANQSISSIWQLQQLQAASARHSSNSKLKQKRTVAERDANEKLRAAAKAETSSRQAEEEAQAVQNILSKIFSEALQNEIGGSPPSKRSTGRRGALISPQGWKCRVSSHRV